MSSAKGIKGSAAVRKRVRGKPKRGVLRHSNQQFSKLLQSFENLFSGEKKLFLPAEAPLTFVRGAFL